MSRGEQVRARTDYLDFFSSVELLLYRFTKTLRHRKEEKASIKHIVVKNPTETSTRCTYVDNERNKLHVKATFFRILPETYTLVDKSEHCRNATNYKSVIDKPTLTVVFGLFDFHVTGKLPCCIRTRQQ